MLANNVRGPNVRSHTATARRTDHPATGGAGAAGELGRSRPGNLRLAAATGLPVAVMLYVLFNQPDASRPPGMERPAGGTGPAVFAAVALVVAITILTTVGHDLLPQLLSAADALVLPSASEGIANAWIEALACGTPIVVPDIGNQFIAMQKDTALASAIAVEELMGRARQAGLPRQHFFEALVVAAAWYWLMTIVMTAFQTRLERRMARSDRSA